MGLFSFAREIYRTDVKGREFASQVRQYLVNAVSETDPLPYFDVAVDQSVKGTARPPRTTVGIT